MNRLAHVEVDCCYEHLKEAVDKCAFVQEYCITESIIDFYDLYYCDIKNTYIFVPVGVSIIHCYFSSSSIDLVDSVPIYKLLLTGINRRWVSISYPLTALSKA